MLNPVIPLLRPPVVSYPIKNKTRDGPHDPATEGLPHPQVLCRAQMAPAFGAPALATEVAWNTPSLISLQWLLLITPISA